ncbi:hypothetical protein RHGRI_004870 [Rhododendron griersonianum]|uniref:Uncharacterized protein n=1 Tax=Rhododendron griersonianum TaxID=479676 RepID=A0AAV6LB83_9ERIC|nr:hypothetical protein RHGRI_004870 [Rhododendron griersonianum]
MFVTVLMTYMIKFNVKITDPTRTIEATVFPKVATEFYSLTAVDAMDVRQTYSDVDSFVEDVIMSGKLWASGVPEVLAGSHVFVCAHANRDKRCRVCGPVLIEKFEKEIETRGLKDQIS